MSKRSNLNLKFVITNTPTSSWGIFNSLLGWQNSATYGSVISYNVYWIAVIIGFIFLGWKERNTSPSDVAEIQSDISSEEHSPTGKNKAGDEGMAINTAVKEIS